MADCSGVDASQKNVLEIRAQDFNSNLKRFEDNEYLGGDHFVEAKHLAQDFLHESLKLGDQQERCILGLAQDINDNMRQKDEALPTINILFTDTHTDLAEFQFEYPYRGFAGYYSHGEIFDLYYRGK